MIKAIVFDFGNVLCKLDREATIAGIAEHCGIDAERIAATLWGGDIERDSETGRIDSREHFRRIKSAIDADPAWSYEDFVEDFGRCIVPYEEGEAAIAAVAELGLRSFVLSNTNYLHARCIFTREALATYPELYALSYKVGFMKPDPRIWRWLLERSGLEAEDCLYIDDVERYCSTAASIGFSTLRYHFSEGSLLQRIKAML